MVPHCRAHWNLLEYHGVYSRSQGPGLMDVVRLRTLHSIQALQGSVTTLLAIQAFVRTVIYLTNDNARCISSIRMISELSPR